ncbi:MAG: hypothetical protein GX034_01480 [Clostridiaceae bacterium]|nr:hypothetical protein [Clostridiaceae bacterium]
MTGFFVWADALRYLITLMLALGVLSQTMLAILSLRRYPRNFGLILENFMESFVLFGIVVFTLMYGQMIHSFFTTLITPTGYEGIRFVAFALITLTVLLVAVIAKNFYSLFLIPLFMLLLPPFELVLTKSFPYLFFIAIVVLLLRSILISLRILKEIRRTISASSIKETIDSIHTAVLFSEPDGLILLINEQMLYLMDTISGKLQRNAKEFYELLTSGELEPGMQREEFEGQLVLHLPNATYWIFSLSKLNIKTKDYFQLAATDITRQWMMMAELQRQETELKLKSERLRESIHKLQLLSGEKAVKKAKLRTHEVLGQRLSLLLRGIRSGDTLDHDLMRSLSEGIVEDLKMEQGVPSPREELDGLEQAFASIGVSIKLEGDLPRDQDLSRTFTDIIKESVTNAVRHGFATEISVKIDGEGDCHQLVITNNGDLPSHPIIEGGGIGAMRNMLEPYGGELDVILDQCFALTVKVAGGKSEL